MKKLIHVQKSLGRHWVGDGFPVRSIFTYHDLAACISPFLLMDYAGPAHFEPSQHRRGVEEHPHRGFETVTIVYSGEVEHRDSAGGGGIIKAGDVQWMTAASGLVHEEKHSENFARLGGDFEMVQLWVNLPKKNKMEKPRYQGLLSQQIPQVNLENNRGYLRVIAGRYLNAQGPAQTFSEINLWDVRLLQDAELLLTVPEGHTVSVFVLSGKINFGGSESIQDAELAVLEQSGTDFQIEATRDSKILVLTGQPLNEPIVGYGPFVMNTENEIKQAFIDYQMGLMGQIATMTSEKSL